MSNKNLAILNTVLCVLALGVSLAFAMGAIFGLAGLGSGGASKFVMGAGGVLATMGLYAPIVPVAALAGGWIAHAQNARKAIIFCALAPWIYMIVVGGLFFLLPSLANSSPKP